MHNSTRFFKVRLRKPSLCYKGGSGNGEGNTDGKGTEGNEGREGLAWTGRTTEGKEGSKKEKGGRPGACLNLPSASLDIFY